VEYKDQAKVERVPKKVKKVEYREERKIETIPKEVTVTDYYAVEYLRQYIPQYVPEKRIEYVQVPKKQVRYEYIPVERYVFNNLDKSFITPNNLLRSKEELFLALKLQADKLFKEDTLFPVKAPKFPDKVELDTLLDTSLEVKPTQLAKPHT
jgi:hypothetical protein